MCKIETVRDLVSYRRLQWLGHVARMNDDRLPKQLLFHQMKAAEKRPGRPIKSWLDYVRADLARLQIAFSWFKMSQDREKWRNTIQTLLDHT